VKYSSDINDCITCSLKDKCITPNTKDFRFTTKYDSNTYDEAYGWYISNHEKNLQKLRRTIIEDIMGQAKEYHGKIAKRLDARSIKYSLNRIKSSFIEFKWFIFKKITIRCSV
jgi:hypothetical protein